MNTVSDELCSQLAGLFCASMGAISEGDRIQFNNVRAVDKVTGLLSHLGFLVPSPEGARGFPFKTIVDASAMPCLATKALIMAEPHKQTLLDFIICFAGDCLDVPVTRHWFNTKTKDQNSLMQILADSEYAVSKDGLYRWSELISPSMRDAGFLDEAGGSHDDGTYAFPD